MNNEEIKDLPESEKGSNIKKKKKKLIYESSAAGTDCLWFNLINHSFFC